MKFLKEKIFSKKNLLVFYISACATFLAVLIFAINISVLGWQLSHVKDQALQSKMTFAIPSELSRLRFPHSARPVDQSQTEKLDLILDRNYPQRNELVGTLPYETQNPNLEIHSEAAILIDSATGSILYEKNADSIIPPASMTKIVEMYVVFEECEKGNCSLNDVVPLPPESWWINLPRDASLMFLAEGQTVTLRELLLGLSIASGNDASIAVAKYVAGSMDSFVEKMNQVVRNLGLTKTHFVESSGYSELNQTTPREFAAIARAYINRFPFALKEFHSKDVLRYPLQKNLPAYQQDQGDSQAIIQYNTNKLLGYLPGADGLKTGYIDESGYNLSLTVERFGTRLISVTMKGPGKGSAWGNYYRKLDGTELMEYGFGNFATFHQTEENSQPYPVSLVGSTEETVNLVPALDMNLTVPYILSDSPKGCASSVHVIPHIPHYLEGEITMGQEYGHLTLQLEDKVLKTIPLVADRSSKAKKKSMATKIACSLYNSR